METPINPSPKVWEDIHTGYVREHIEKAIEQCEDIMIALALYANTGHLSHWKDAVMLIDSLEEKVHRGSLERVRRTAYYVCESCDSDICTHAERYNF